MPGGATRAVVVGGGPAGALAAIMLARQGVQVDLYDANHSPHGLGDRFTYPIALNVRALASLRAAGVELPPDVGGEFTGSVLHAPGGRLIASPTKESAIVGRNDFTRYLLEQARAHPSGNIKVHMRWKLSQLAEGGDVAVFERPPLRSGAGGEQPGDGAPGGEEPPLRVEGYHLLIGADGVGSSVRSELVRLDEEKGLPPAHRLTVRQVKNRRRFKRFPTLPAGAESSPCLAGHPGHIHAWRGATCGASILLVPRPGGGFLGILVSPEDKRLHLADLKTAEVVGALFRKDFPEVLELMESCQPDFQQWFADEVIGHGGTSTYCSRLHGGHVLLLGDAAHSMYPSLGQGCNSALEDVAQLAQVLKEHGLADGGPFDVPAALSDYTARRLEDAAAIVQLSERPPFPDTGPVTAALILARTVAFNTVRKVVPSFRGPLRFRANMSSTMPYSRVKRQLAEDNLAATAILATAAACVVAAIYGVAHVQWA